MSTTALVLHSGGLDSTVCLRMAQQMGRHVVSLGVDYGQTHRVELDYAADQCRRFGVERRVLSVSWAKPRRSVPTNREVDEMRREVSPAFLPARNGLFLMLAIAEAAGLNAGELWVGVNSVDFSGYPDCTPEFMSSFRALMKVGVPGGPRLLAPLQRMSKRQIAQLATKLGVEAGDTWSCYRPRVTRTGLSPCGECDACVLHRHAWSR